MLPVIKLLQIEDLKAVKDLSKHIWEGDDYLQKVAKHWIEDGNFWGMFDADELVGCGKITLLPDKVIWLEGLRIHPEHQGKGLGKALSAHIMKAAMDLAVKDDYQYIEFSTYYLNVESIHIATQAGFKLIDEYYILSHKPVKPASTQPGSRIHDDVTNYFPKSIPYGWKFLHPTKQAIKWLNNKTKLMKADFGYFYVGGEQPTVCLLSPAGEWMEKALPVMQQVLGKKQNIEILLHKSRQAEISTLLAMDFHWWDEDKEDIVQVYRYQPD
jgi:GNAT superfamily N-acetyltransferase